MDRNEYNTFVAMLAQNALNLGESPRTAASVSVISIENVGDEKAIRFSAEPFVNNPVTDERLWPKDVITGSSRRHYPASLPDDLRDLAVEILKRDVYDAMMGIENDTMAELRA